MHACPCVPSSQAAPRQRRQSYYKGGTERAADECLEVVPHAGGLVTDVGWDYVPHMSTGIAATRPNVRMVGSVMIAFSFLLVSPLLPLWPDDVDALRPLVARSTSAVPPCCSRSGKLEYIAHVEFRLIKDVFQANLCVRMRKPQQRVETCKEDGCSNAAKRVHILVI